MSDQFRGCPHTVSTTDPRRLVDVLVEGGVQRHVAEVLPCPDVHDMAATIARSNYLARTARRLLLDEFAPPPPKRNPVTHWPSILFALVSLFGGVALFIICSPLWRTFT